MVGCAFSLIWGGGGGGSLHLDVGGSLFRDGGFWRSNTKKLQVGGGGGAEIVIYASLG